MEREYRIDEFGRSEIERKDGKRLSWHTPAGTEVVTPDGEGVIVGIGSYIHTGGPGVSNYVVATVDI